MLWVLSCSTSSMKTKLSNISRPTHTMVGRLNNLAGWIVRGALTDFLEEKIKKLGSRPSSRQLAKLKADTFKFVVRLNDNGESFTDCQTFIELGWDAEFLMRVIELEPRQEQRAKWWAALKGIIEHEVAHSVKCSVTI